MRKRTSLQNIFSQSGQTLMELIIAIALIATALLAVLNLFLSNFNGEQEAKARIIAVNLARESLEGVKNVRDSNWLKLEANQRDCGPSQDELCRWDENLSGDGTAVISGIAGENFQLNYDVDSFSDPGSRVYLSEATGLYNNDSDGRPTRYYRLLFLENICCPTDADGHCQSQNNDFQFRSSCLAGEEKVGIRVQSKVNWELAGRSRQLTLEDHLFNWR